MNGGLPSVSPLLFGWFARYGERFLARHFHTVRLARAERPDAEALHGRPLIVYLNHPSWWDPMVALLLAMHLFPDRRHYAPIEAAALSRYRFFERLGFFGVEPGTVGGARRFLTVAERVLKQPDAVLWITAGGRFADPRERPVRLRSGLGHLISRLDQVVVLPLALEYPFWEERFPEALARFGKPQRAGRVSFLDPAAWTLVLGDQLESVQQSLAADAIARDPARFEILLGGKAGVGGVYDVWRRFRASLRGERFRPEHGGLES